MLKHALVIAAALGAAHVHAQAQAPAPATTLAVPLYAEETGPAGLQSRFDGPDEYMVGGGVAVFDCDGNGMPELFVTGGVQKSKLYRNNSKRGGPIQLKEERSGLELTNANGAYPIDIDADGISDLVVLRVGELAVFKGLGQCKFERANTRWNIPDSNDWHTAFAATWEKGQTLPTLAIGSYYDRSRPNYPWGTCTPGLLLRPDASGKKYGVAQTLQPSFCALSMVFSDWNRSGEPSLRVSNDREYYKGGREQLWRVPPGAPATEYTAEDGWRPLQIWGMGIASTDIDGDGYPEYYLTSMADNKFQKLDPQMMAALTAGQPVTRPSYIDQAYKRGITAHRPYVGGDVKPSTAWHAQFADVNNDGLADLFISKGNVSTMPDFALQDPNDLLLQERDGRFTEVGQQARIASFLRGRGGMVADLNADGLLDIVVVNRLDKAQLWRNLGAGSAGQGAPMGRWLQLRLQQSGPNRDAIGAWVEVDLGAGEGGRIVRQELSIGGGHASGQLGWMHFGLGQAQAVKLRVQWPHGDWGPWQDVQADGFYTVHRDSGVQMRSAP